MKIALVILGVIAVYIIFRIVYFKMKMKNYDPSKVHENVKILDDNNFNHQIHKGISLVDFWAAWCMPCRMQGPIIDELANEIGVKVNICKMDIDKNQKIAQKLNVRSIPTLVLFKDGKEVERFVGVKSKQALLKSIERLSV